MSKKIFISYNHHDRVIAERVKTALLQRGMAVTMDIEDMKAGANIDDFIVQSIRETDVTLSIVSKDSLVSGWVASESVTAFYSEKLQSQKRFIACFVDDDFLKPDFRLKATEQIDASIDEIDKMMQKYAEKGLDTSDLNGQKSRLHKVRFDLGAILQRLKDSLTLDIRGPEFDRSLDRIVAAIADVKDRTGKPLSRTSAGDIEPILCVKAETEFQVRRRQRDESPFPPEMVRKLKANREREYGPFKVFSDALTIRIEGTLLPILEDRIQLEAGLRRDYGQPFTSERLDTVRKELTTIVADEWIHIVRSSCEDAIDHALRYSRAIDYKVKELEQKRDQYLRTLPTGVITRIDEMLQLAMADSVLASRREGLPQ